MLKIIFYSVFVLNTIGLNAKSSLIDYGVKGVQYEIAEEDFYEMVQKKLKDLKVQNIKKQLTENIYRSLKSNIDISACVKDQQDYIENDYVIAPIDVVLPSGEVLAKKGESITIPKNIHLPDVELCLIDGTNESKMIDDINHLYEQNHKCNFVLNNYSISDFKKKFPQVNNVYILDNSIVKRFRVSCLPTRIELRGNIASHYFIRKDENE